MLAQLWYTSLYLSHFTDKKYIFFNFIPTFWARKTNMFVWNVDKQPIIHDRMLLQPSQSVFKLQQSEIRVGARSSSGEKNCKCQMRDGKKKKNSKKQTGRQIRNQCCTSAHICMPLLTAAASLHLQMLLVNISWCLCLTRCWLTQCPENRRLVLRKWLWQQ